MSSSQGAGQLIDFAELSGFLNLGAHNHISLVGGGGKTTLLFALADQLNGTIALTTTTKMGITRTEGHTVLIDPTDEELSEALDLRRKILVWRATDGHKALGVTPQQCDRWFVELCDHVIVEADGSRRKPFKAPAAYEPVVGASTTLVINCIGAAALGTQISSGCHRPELVAKLAGCAPSDPLTPERAAAVLTHPDGGRRNVPAGARQVVALNRMSRTDVAAFALADHLVDLDIEVVCVAERSMG